MFKFEQELKQLQLDWYATTSIKKAKQIMKKITKTKVDVEHANYKHEAFILKIIIIDLIINGFADSKDI